MYKIANVTTRDEKVVKPMRIGRTVYSVDQIKYPDGRCVCYAEYADPEFEGKALLTSEEILRTEGTDTGTITVVTRNSVYTFERI